MLKLYKFGLHCNDLIRSQTCIFYFVIQCIHFTENQLPVYHLFFHLLKLTLYFFYFCQLFIICLLYIIFFCLTTLIIILCGFQITTDCCQSFSGSTILPIGCSCVCFLIIQQLVKSQISSISGYPEPSF